MIDLTLPARDFSSPILGLESGVTDFGKIPQAKSPETGRRSLLLRLIFAVDRSGVFVAGRFVSHITLEISASRPERRIGIYVEETREPVFPNMFSQRFDEKLLGHIAVGAPRVLVGRHASEKFLNREDLRRFRFGDSRAIRFARKYHKANDLGHGTLFCFWSLGKHFTEQDRDIARHANHLGDRRRISVGSV